MGAKLLVRNYNVGCGDCTYIRIPDDGDGFHILIDCGSKESAKTGVMRRALADIEQMLPSVPGGTKKRLDLLAVTHRHEDHIKGFDPDLFDNMKIGHIWLSAAMDESHKQATGTHKLHEFAGDSIKALAAPGTALSPELSELVGMHEGTYGIGNKGAMSALTDGLPKKSGIKPAYVHAGQTSDELGVAIPDGKITVLGPEEDIDGYYLGKDLDASFKGMDKSRAEFRAAAGVPDGVKPTNISPADFQMLQSRLLSNGLSFAVDDSSIQNNVSTILLIEWRKRRLLFVGDGEWHGEYHEGRKNGTWNVMWKLRRKHLSKPLDFLKVGHHGSKNASPWNRDEGPEHEVNQILNAILPLPKGGKKPTAQCVVSTKRKQYVTIPDGDLMVELGKRVANTRTYEKEFKQADPQFDPDAHIYNYSVEKKYSGKPDPIEVGDKGTLSKPQPLRTDMESIGKGDKEMPGTVEFIDVEIAP